MFARPSASDKASEIVAVSQLFAELDRNEDGHVSAHELRAFLSKMAAPGALLRKLNVASTDAAADALLEMIDTNHDGRITCATTTRRRARRRACRFSDLRPSLPLPARAQPR